MWQVWPQWAGRALVHQSAHVPEDCAAWDCARSVSGASADYRVLECGAEDWGRGGQLSSAAGRLAWAGQQKDLHYFPEEHVLERAVGPYEYAERNEY